MTEATERETIEGVIRNEVDCDGYLFSVEGMTDAIMNVIHLARPMTVAEAAKVLLDDPVARRELCSGADFVRFRLRALSQGGE